MAARPRAPLSYGRMAISFRRWTRGLGRLPGRRARGRPRRLCLEIIGNVRGAIYRLGPDVEGPFEYVSDGIKAVTGRTAEDFLERNIPLQSLIAPPDAARRLEEIRAALGARKPFDLEYRLKPDGREVWLREQGRGVFDEGGTLLSVDGLLTDVTERRRLVREEYLPLMIHWVKDYAIYMLDTEGRVISWNRGAERIKGWREEEILGRNFSVFFTPEDVQARKPERELETALSHGSYEDEDWRVRKDGSRFWASVVVTPVYDRSHRLIGFAKVTRDLSERVEAQATTERLRQIADVVPSIVWVCEPGGRTTYLNKRWADYTGADERSSLGEGWHRFVHPADVAASRAFWDKAAESGTPYEAELRIRGTDGTYRWFLVRGVPIRDAGQRVAAYFGTSVDIDEKVRSEKALKRASDTLEAAVRERTVQLESAVAELETFSYTAAHDLRAPLRTLSGYAELLLRDAGPRLGLDDRGRLLKLTQSAGRLDALISDLLLYAGIGREGAAPAPVDLDAAVAEILERPEFREAETQVRAPLGRVLAQPTLLAQAVSNLLSNAVKFARPDERPSISVWGETRGAGRRLWIEDEGIGIEPALIPRIFKPFVRAHAAEYPGTGIGLAIVKKAVERMGGSVGVESTPGQGSRFWLELPEDR